MFTKTMKTVALALLFAGSVAVAQDGIYFNVAEGDKEHAYNTMVNEKIEEIELRLQEAVDNLRQRRIGAQSTWRPSCRSGSWTDWQRRSTTSTPTVPSIRTPSSLNAWARPNGS